MAHLRRLDFLNQLGRLLFSSRPVHPVEPTLRPAIWPKPILNERDDLAVDILGVASPDSGSALTVVIQP